MKKKKILDLLLQLQDRVFNCQYIYTYIFFLFMIYTHLFWIYVCFCVVLQKNICFCVFKNTIINENLVKIYYDYNFEPNKKLAIRNILKSS